MVLPMFSSAKQILKKNTMRLAPMWALYTVALILLFPICTVAPYAGRKIGQLNAATCIQATALIGGAVFSMLFAVLCAALCFSYLTTARSAYAMHALPVTRGSLYAANLASGLLYGLVPFLLAILLCIPIFNSAVYGACIRIYLLEYLFYYGLAVFCMMVTATPAAGVLVYFFANIAVASFEYLTFLFVEPMLYGLRHTPVTTPWSPIIRVLSLPDYTGTDRFGDCFGWYSWVLGAVGILLLVLAWLIYRKRNLECAGDFIAFEPLRPVLRILFALMIMLVLTAFISLILWNDPSPDAYPIETLMLLLVSAFIGIFIAELMLRRGKRILTRALFLRYGVIALAVILCGICLKLDFLGYVNEIPDPKEVSSVTVIVSGHGVTLTDPADIAGTTETHSKIVEYGKAENHSYIGACSNVGIVYTLQNGKTMVRYYSEVYTPVDNGPTTLSYLASPRVSVQFFEQYFARAANVAVEYQDPKYGYISLDLDSAEAEGLKRAVLQDAEAGTLTMFSDPKTDGCAILESAERDYLLIIGSTEETVSLNQFYEGMGIHFTYSTD